MKDAYIRKEVEEITEIPARRIQFFTDSDLLSLNKQTGRGRERLYSPQNIFELLIVKELSKHGVQLAQIKRIIIDLPKKIKINAFFDFTRFEEGSDYFLTISDDGRVTYSQEVKDVKISLLGKRAKGHSSILILNLSIISEQMRGV